MAIRYQSARHLYTVQCVLCKLSSILPAVPMDMALIQHW